MIIGVTACGLLFDAVGLPTPPPLQLSRRDLRCFQLLGLSRLRHMMLDRRGAELAVKLLNRMNDGFLGSLPPQLARLLSVSRCPAARVADGHH